MVMPTLSDDWRVISNGSNAYQNPFLCKLPHLSKTSPEQLTSPTDFDDETESLQSEDGRTNSPTKLAAVFRLLDDMYKTYTVRFHWNLDMAVELSGVIRADPANNIVTVSRESSTSSQPRSLSTPLSNSDYELHSSMAIPPKNEDDPLSFWVGIMVHVHRGQSRVVQEISVHWYEFYRGTDPYTAKYHGLH